MWELLAMLFINHPSKQSAILLKKVMIVFLHILDNNVLNDMQSHRVRAEIELGSNNFEIARIFGLHLPIFI